MKDLRKKSVKSFKFGNSTCNFLLLPTLYKNYRYILFKTQIRDSTIYRSNLLQSQTSYKEVKIVELQAGQAQNITGIARPAETDLRRYKLFSTRCILHVNYQ